MPDHKISQILDALVANIGVATSAGTNVFRSLARPLPADALLAIKVRFGSLEAPEMAGPNLADTWLNVFVDLSAVSASPATLTSGTKPDYESSLVQLLKEVHINIMADITQGLNFVIETEPAGTSEPDENGEGGEVVAVFRSTWRVKFRSNYLDPSA